MGRRWRGQAERLEVWYATLSDPNTETGCWIHHELVSPVAGDPYSHGWAAVFRPGADPVLGRLAGARRGHDAPAPGAPLFTFPRWVWEREALPSARVVVVPTAPFSGT